MTDNLFRHCDEFGPTAIIHVHNPAAGLKGIVVVDNVAAGPAIGGTRMEPDVTLLECLRLARAMTWKNAAAGLPHGGAKSVIVGDPSMPAGNKEQIIRAFARSIEQIESYIPGPDMGTDERAMAWIHDEIGRSVGLPREIGGIPLDEIGATGFGMAIAAEAAQDFSGVRLDDARIVVQGFGAVGIHAARFLCERGAVLVGAADSRSATVNPDGLDLAALIEHKRDGRPVGSFARGRALPDNDVTAVPCDIWLPAARPDVIREDNAGRLRCRLVIQGANIPATDGAERILHDRGILVVPDFIANAGGVICASVEHHGGIQSTAFSAIEEKVRLNTEVVLSAATRQNILPRIAALDLAEARVRRSMALRRWH